MNKQFSEEQNSSICKIKCAIHRNNTLFHFQIAFAVFDTEDSSQIRAHNGRTPKGSEYEVFIS